MFVCQIELWAENEGREEVWWQGKLETRVLESLRRFLRLSSGHFPHLQNAGNNVKFHLVVPTLELVSLKWRKNGLFQICRRAFSYLKETSQFWAFAHAFLWHLWHLLPATNEQTSERLMKKLWSGALKKEFALLWYSDYVWVSCSIVSGIVLGLCCGIEYSSVYSL